MKRRGRIRALVLSTFCMLFVFAACGKPKIEPHVPLQEVLIQYEADSNIQAFTALEDGTVFLVVYEELAYKLYQYNAQGECKASYLLEDYSNIGAVAAKENKETVYFTGQCQSELSLFALQTGTGQIDTLCVLKDSAGLVQARQLVLLDNRLYVVGQGDWNMGVGSLGREYDFSAGDRLVCCSVETKECYPLPLEFPVSIAPQENGTLMILGYLPSEGCCLMEYDPKRDKIEIKKSLAEYKFDSFAVCNAGESLIYNCKWNQYGLVVADINNLDMEIEIYENALQRSFSPVWYAGGRVYCQERFSNQLVSFPLDAVQRQNETVRLVSTEALASIAPYGCGYALERIELGEEEREKIMLKMLAQDRDYDLCMASTEDSGSLIMRNSNLFYPLNDLPGIEEYFEKCFPYVREAAVNDEGAIWMLPFSVSVYGMLVQEERMEQTGIYLHDNMNLSEFADLVCGLSEEEQGLFEIYPENVSRSFINQYFWHNSSAEGEFYLECMKSLRTLHQNEDLLFLENTMLYQDELLCHIMRFDGGTAFDKVMLQFGTAVYSIPKGSSTDKNNAACHFLAVNPDSRHLSETLSYLADLIAYMTERDDLWYFKDFPAEPGSLEEQIHSLYENGEISFAIDEDVYGADYAGILMSELPLEEYVQETERRYRMYQGE